MSLGEQVVSLSVGVSADELPTADIQRFEQDVLGYMRDHYQDVLDDITKSEELSDEAKAKIDEVIEKVKGDFNPSG